MTGSAGPSAARRGASSSSTRESWDRMASPTPGRSCRAAGPASWRGSAARGRCSPTTTGTTPSRSPTTCRRVKPVPLTLRLAAGLALALGLLIPQAALGAGAGSFGPTGSMGTARYAAAAAPLKDGRVLVAGGFYDDGGGDHYLASGEGFNPAPRSFTAAGIGALGGCPPGAGAAPHPGRGALVAGG